MTRRISRLNSIIKKKKLDSFLVTNPPNVYYISGFRSQDASLLITRDTNFLITDFRYKEEAGAISNFEVKLLDRPYKDTLKKISKDLNIKSMGFEADSLSYSKANLLKEALKKEKVELRPTSGIIEGLRLLKDEREIKEIESAIAIARKALAALKIKPGITEKRLAQEIDNLATTYGADKNAFTTIVASGENSSRPHSELTGRIIRKNELVVIDFGVTFNMYNCDLTRVYILGKIKPLLYTIYHICKEAQRRAIKAIRPGQKASAIDKIAREYIASKGFGKFFGHALGHGVGLAVHEEPLISSKNSQVLKAGMVFTIEPGIYIENTGGVRIEDVVQVTEKGCKVLTDDIPK